MIVPSLQSILIDAAAYLFEVLVEELDLGKQVFFVEDLFYLLLDLFLLALDALLQPLAGEEQTLQAFDALALMTTMLTFVELVG